MIRTLVRAALAASLMLATTASFAHITLEVQQATLGGGYKAILRVPHGCAGSATTSIRVKVPEGFISAKPMPKAGWTLDIVTGPYAQAYEQFGSQVTEGATEIVWSGGNLPDNQYDEFVIRGTIAGSLEAGSKLYFPIIQTCTEGEEAWIDTSGGESEFPAPGLLLQAAP